MRGNMAITSVEQPTATYETSGILQTAIDELATRWQEAGSHSHHPTLLALSPQIRSLLAHHAWIVGLAIEGQALPLPNAVFVEYGGGTGLESLIARQLGIGTIAYNDIDPAACSLAEEVAGELGLKANLYVCGDIDELVQTLGSHRLQANIITSYDALEHIYDIDYFFWQLHAVCKHDATMVLSSGANMFWYPYVKHASKMQKDVEAIGLDTPTGVFIGPFLPQRYEIIMRLAPSLSEQEAMSLAKDTRGLALADITQEVNSYLQTGTHPRQIEHSTNTCCPVTGSWAERSMNPYYLAAVLRSTGFASQVVAKPFHKVGHRVVDTLASLLNQAARIVPTDWALYFSPSYAIYAKYIGTPTHKRHHEHIYRHRRHPVFFMVGFLYELISLVHPRKGYYKSQWE